MTTNIDNNNMNKDIKKNSVLIISIIMGVLFISGVTYAILAGMNVTNAVYSGETACFDIDYDITNDDGTSPITGTLMQTTTAKGGLSGKVTMNINANCDVRGIGSIKLNVTNATEALLKTSEAHCENPKTLKTLKDYTTADTCSGQADGIWVTNGSALKYAVYTDLNADAISVGYINQNGDIVIYDNFELSKTPTSYYIYIWLDGELTDNSYKDATFEGYIHASVEYVRDDNTANAPVLDEGMIPVTISNDGTVTTISEDDENWYSYETQQWANVVLVSDENRQTYLDNLSNNVIVSQDDILAYYVWIPRYRYKIWTTDATTTTSQQTIDIVFESTTAVMSNGTQVGQYKTHPAFWWDADSDDVVDSSEMLSGVWVGKFETTGAASLPTIVPNSASLVSQNVSTQFVTSLKFSGGTLSSGNVTFSGNTTYGLTDISDSHMADNTDWGAVAYLSHSQYGINDEININNYYSSGFKTGCGASTAEAEESTTCDIVYGEATSYPQSTTGNITGIFDMSGGAWEYVMGVLSDGDGNPRSGYGTSANNSGFTGMLADGSSYTGIAFPEKKYYDLYLQSQFTETDGTNISLCTLDSCGGHALYETAGWYGDQATFAYPDYPWFVRGASYASGEYAGIFYAADGGYGQAHYLRSWRSVIVIPNYMISYDANGGSGAPASQTKTYGVDLTLSSTVPTKTGYVFLGWSTSANATTPTYQPGDSYTANASATLYAVWGSNNIFVNRITGLYNSSSKSTLTSDNVDGAEFTYATDTSLVKFNLEKNYTGYDNIRYYGANPNNYAVICDDSLCETYYSSVRILGVINGSIRAIDENVANLQWDSSNSTNYWGESTLSYELSDVGMTETSSLSYSNWYYGLLDMSVSLLTAEELVVAEYGDNLYVTSMYSILSASDYALATDLTKVHGEVYSSNNAQYNWLYKSSSSDAEWLMTGNSQTEWEYGTQYHAWTITSSGSLYPGDAEDWATSMVNQYNNVRPVYSINSSAIVVDGTGTSSDPYQLYVSQ